MDANSKQRFAHFDFMHWPCIFSHQSFTAAYQEEHFVMKLGSVLLLSMNLHRSCKDVNVCF